MNRAHTMQILIWGALICASAGYLLHEAPRWWRARQRLDRVQTEIAKFRSK